MDKLFTASGTVNVCGASPVASKVSVHMPAEQDSPVVSATADERTNAAADRTAATATTITHIERPTPLTAARRSSLARLTYKTPYLPPKNSVLFLE
jgi:hypothetical protein